MQIVLAIIAAITLLSAAASSTNSGATSPTQTVNATGNPLPTPKPGDNLGGASG